MTDTKKGSLSELKNRTKICSRLCDYFSFSSNPNDFSSSYLLFRIWYLPLLLDAFFRSSSSRALVSVIFGLLSLRSDRRVSLCWFGFGFLVSDWNFFCFCSQVFQKLLIGMGDTDDLTDVIRIEIKILHSTTHILSVERTVRLILLCFFAFVYYRIRISCSISNLETNGFIFVLL